MTTNSTIVMANFIFARMKSHIGEMFLIFDEHRNDADAVAMKAYMKGQFEYCGIKTGPRRMLTKAHNQGFVLEEKDFLPFVQICFAYPEREMHHYALDTIASFKKKFTNHSLQISEFFCEKNVWWDTVDMANSFINYHIFKKDRDLLVTKAMEWKDDPNFWKRRLALIAQLKFRQETNPELLEKIILSNLNATEFFINKAIGWVLGEYNRTNPEWVVNFTQKKALNPLSKREALRLIK